MKQATHVRPSNVALITIAVAANGGFVALTNCGWGEPDYRNVPSSAAAFSTAEECGAWILGCLQNVTAEKFGAKKL